MTTTCLRTTAASVCLTCVYLLSNTAIAQDEPPVTQSPFTSLSQISLARTDSNGAIPPLTVDPAVIAPSPVRPVQPMCVQWQAAALCHRPLSFEDVSLERYGHTKQPELAESLLAGSRYFGRLAILPYKMGVDCPHDCEYAAGFARPGNCARPVKEHLPASAKGLLFESLAVSGIVFVP